MAQILLVGTATLDIVYALERYPAEDDEVRAQGLRVCRGGNAANSAVVLAQQGHRCSFAGVLAAAPETAVIEDDFLSYGVDCGACARLPGRPPTSGIQLTPTSRTIVHYRNLPELAAEQFAQINLEPFDWVHFEGRNVPELLKMLARVRMLRPQLPVSLELEKPRDGIVSVLSHPTLLLCSRAYALDMGYADPHGFLAHMRKQAPQADIVAAWGDAGAYALGRDGAVVNCPAFPPQRVVDTLGAGDTFNAGLLGGMLDEMPLPAALEAGCRLAGEKCGIEGFLLPSLQAAQYGRLI